MRNMIDSENNDKGYSLRNHALYYHRMGDLKTAKENYELAFKNAVIPIDFLEYHYSELLFKLGDDEKGLDLLVQAVNKGEKCAIDRYNDIRK